MFIDLNSSDFYVKPGPTDMRKQIRGLSVLVEGEMRHSPFTGNLFLFCGRSRKLIKVLYWDKTGFAMWQKKLEKAKFPWPSTEEQAKQISVEEFKMILSGIDFWNTHQELQYKSLL